jgi:16S rRNA (cytosine1402-N4)-methyltransferase
VKEVVAALKAKTATVIMDVTLGDGGHSLALLKAMREDARVLGMDQDEEAINRAQARLAGYGSRFRAIQGNFSNLASHVATQGVKEVDGILADLGVSYLQLNEARKGFSFMTSGPLDMRMNKNLDMTAETALNELSENELADIIRAYGEERQTKQIVRAIVSHRKISRIKTTDQLTSIVQNAIRQKDTVKTLARVFQALRIFINKELDNLQQFLPQAVSLLKSSGRLVIISYHSLEDRIVKDFFRKEADPCICPKDFPRCVCGLKPRLKIIGKLVRPSEDEISRIRTARSARMRVAEKVQA